MWVRVRPCAAGRRDSGVGGRVVAGPLAGGERHAGTARPTDAGDGSVCRAEPLVSNRHGPLHRDGAQVPLSVEHHRHRVPRPGAQGRGLGGGHEGDRSLFGQRSEIEMEEAPRQLPRRVKATERDDGARAGRGCQRARQARLPLEVLRSHAVPTAAHGQPPQAGRARAASRLQRLQLRLRASAAAAQASPRARTRTRTAAARSTRTPTPRAVRAGPPRHILQQHVPVDETVSVPDADQDKAVSVRGGDGGGGGSAGGAAELRQPVGRQLLRQLGARREAVLSG